MPIFAYNPIKLLLLTLLATLTIGSTSNASGAPSHKRGERSARDTDSDSSDDEQPSARQRARATSPAVEENLCGICLIAMNNADHENPQRKLRCGTITAPHAFHQACINQWGRMNATCPKCRTPFFMPPPITTLNSVLAIEAFLNNPEGDIHTVFETGETLFQRAQRMDDIDCMRYLLTRDRSLANRHYPNGNTPLINAANTPSRERRYAQCSFLLEQGAEANLPDAASGIIPLERIARNCMYANKEETFTLIDLFLRYGADINRHFSYGQTYLTYALINYNTELVTYLLERGANPSAPNRDGQIPLEMTDQLSSIKLLVGKGADINTRWSTGSTLLINACQSNDYGLILQCLELGADSTVADTHGKTPLAYCSEYHCMQRLATAAGVNINLQLPSGETPLSLACLVNRPTDVTALLANGADINMLNAYGKTPLEVAHDRLQCEEHRSCDSAVGIEEDKKCLEILGMLLRAGANINQQYTDGTTPLTRACRKNSYGPKMLLLDLLLRQRPSVNIIDGRGETPLTVACAQGQIDTVRLLLRHKADPEHINRHGIAPLEASRRSANTAVIAALVSLLRESIAEKTERDNDFTCSIQ